MSEIPPFVRAPNNYVVTELGQIDPRDLSPHVPIRWSDYPANQRPYTSPIEEYIRSPYKVSCKMLRERWFGLYVESDLKVLRETMDMRLKRRLYQDEMLKNALTGSISADVHFQTRTLDKEIIDLCALIEEVQADLENGYEYRPAKGQHSGLGYVQQPLSVDSKVKLAELRIKLSDCIARRLGLANDVVKVTVAKEESLEERMARLMGENDAEFAILQAVVKGAIKGGTLGNGSLTAVQGDDLTSNYRAEKQEGRIIDSVPLPRLEDLNE
jgi:hypothetical protein